MTILASKRISMLIVGAIVTLMSVLGSPPQATHAAIEQAVIVKLKATVQAANVRQGPSLSHEIIGVTLNSDSLPAIGWTEQGDWLRVQFRGQVGWLAAHLVQPEPLLHGLPIVNDEGGPLLEPDKFLIPTTPLSCAVNPVRGFGTVWHNQPQVQHLLGCPFTTGRRDEHATAAAVQTFERGWMLWLETDTVQNVDPIYVFYETDGGYTRYGDRPLVDAHHYTTTPRGFHKIGDRFAKVYWESLSPTERAKLGWATNEARDSKGAFQEFPNGRMFWSGEADRIYVIYEGHYDFDGDGQTIYQRQWLSYEDLFEG